METVKCKYLFNDDYNPKYINGAQGGINTQGEIVINFYFERNALPNSQTFKIDESGHSELVSNEPKDLQKSLLRVVENGIIMNYKTAKEMHKWLGSHIEKLESLTEEK